MSRSYRIKLDYTLHGSPELFVSKPDLRALAGERKILHLYDQQRIRLCLYLPETNEWYDRRFLADTLVPWSVLWLFYFEEWLISENWKGGGFIWKPHSANTTVLILTARNTNNI